MINPRKPFPDSLKRAFSMVEMVVVIAILTLLAGAGASLLGGTGSQARKAGTDALSGLIEQARTSAITTRSHVILAIAEPADLPAGDERCRVGLFQIPEWPDGTSSPLSLNGVLLSRWQPLVSGVILIGGEVNDIANPMDGEQVTINYGGSKSQSVTVHAIAFNPRGGLQYPFGSEPVALRIAEGAYRGGKASPNRRGDEKTITENRLQIGRVTARPYRIDG